MTRSAFRFKELARWTRSGFWAVADQGLFAVANFALNVMLARWLSQQEYGAFTIAYAAFLLFGTFHTALWTEPMLVFGAGRYSRVSKEYLGVLSRLHWLATSGCAGAVVVVVLVSGHFLASFSAAPFLALAFAGPCILFQWLMRRACYAQLNPRPAAVAGLLYLCTTLGALYLLIRFDMLSAVTALVVMALASLVSGFWLALRLGLPWRSTQPQAFTTEVVRQHWFYGRWAVGTAGLTWIPGNIYYLVLPLWSGLEGTAALRAILNIMMPILLFNSALGTILLPTFVKAVPTGNLPRLTRLFSLFFVVSSLFYFALVLLFAEPLFLFLYGGQYLDSVNLVWILGWLPVSSGVVAVLGGAVRALERPRDVFWAYVVATLLALTVGLAFVFVWGVYGAALGWLLTSCATVVVLAWFLRRSKGLPV